MIRIDFAPDGAGYVIFGEHERERAMKMWNEERSRCVRIRELSDIHDEGKIIDGLPIYVEHLKYGLN